VKAGVIISAGGKETGEKGRDIEMHIKEEAKKGSIRLLGPNCVGIIATDVNLYASFVGKKPRRGRLAFISQSGAMCSAIIDLSLQEHIGFSHFVSIGSMLDIDFADLIDYLGGDSAVSSIVLYMEAVTNARKFMSAARAVSRGKPIVVLKSGRSKAGARAAASHTGAIAGEDDVYDAAFKRAGIVRIHTLEELFDCAELMAKEPAPTGSRLAVVTNAGGPGVMASDALSSCGLEPGCLTRETIRRLDAFLPSFWSHGNPIDILGDATPERYRRTIEVCLSAPEVNGLLIILAPQTMTAPASVARSLAEALRNKSKATFAVFMGAEDVKEGIAILNEAGIPTYETPERAVESFRYLYSYQQNVALLQETPPRLDHALKFDQPAARNMIEGSLRRDERFLTEMESKGLLNAYGIPVNETRKAASAEEAVFLAQQMGYPVAMKVCSPDIIHKSDALGVHLNLHDEKDVTTAFSEIMRNAHEYNPQARLSGVSVQPMLQRPDYELILGSKQDPDFGPVLLFGMGGIMTEILKDHDIALPPLNRLLARRLIESTRVYELLKGYRSRPPANLVLLEEILIRLSQLVSDFPEIRELDINPLFLMEQQACAVDARIRICSSEVSAPLHLVISPYPNQYEMTTTTRAGVTIFIRPIKPEDEPLLADLFHRLSPESIYFRFFHPMHEVPHSVLARCTQIDYDRDMALVAFEHAEPEKNLLGVARAMSNPRGIHSEFAIVVDDRWHRRGIGTALLQHLMNIAQERHMEPLVGYVLPGNTGMLALARNLGFAVTRDPQSNAYTLTLGNSATR